MFASRYTVSTCSERCATIKRAIDRTHSRHRRRELVKHAYVEPVHWRILFREDGPTCHICGDDTDPNDFTVATLDGKQIFTAGLAYPSVDHVVALSMGGAHVRSNARLAHMYCNAIKGAQPLASLR